MKISIGLCTAMISLLVLIYGLVPLCAQQDTAPPVLKETTPTASIAPEPTDMRQRLLEMLPDTVEGWQQNDKPKFYEPANLFNYIDGSADLFLAYDFKCLLAAKYDQGKPDQAFISLDIYDMGTPINAFGIYSAERILDQKYIELGEQGYQRPDLIVLWKNRYIVKVSAVISNDTPPSAVMMTMAKHVAEIIPNTPALPQLDLLPADGKVVNSEKYARKNYLGQGFLTNVVSATYEIGEGTNNQTATAFMMEAADAKQALAAFTKLRAFEAANGKWLGDLNITGMKSLKVKDPYSGTLLVVQRDKYVTGVYAEASSTLLRPVLDRLLARISAQILAKHGII
jgi:hypothetical protein